MGLAENTEHLNHEPGYFLGIQSFAQQVIHDDVDAFENHLEDIALDVGVAMNNLVRENSVDALYLTSIGFLFIITIAIVSGLVTYK